MADMKASKKSTAPRDAADDKRDARYKVEREKCDALAGDRGRVRGQRQGPERQVLIEGHPPMKRPAVRAFFVGECGAGRSAFSRVGDEGVVEVLGSPAW